MFVEKLRDGTTKITGAPFGLLDAWPINSIYMSISATSPSDFFGGGWVRFGQGRVLVGVNESDPFFDVPEEVGGNQTQTKTLVAENLPPHVHGIPGHNHQFNVRTEPGGQGVAPGTGEVIGQITTDLEAATDTGPGPGDSEPIEISIIQPYITVYMWKRVS